MGRRRRPPINASKDANHQEIEGFFDSLGWSVHDTSNVGCGFPDLVVGGVLGPWSSTPYARVTLLVEIKNPDARGQLNQAQRSWHSGWRGQVACVQTLEDVQRLVGQMPPEGA